jgi:predicted esterase
MRSIVAVFILGILVSHAMPQEPDPASTVKSARMQAGDDARKSFFLMEPKTPKPPKAGYGLIVVMPGGDGSAEFEPFVKRVYAQAIPDNCLLVQLIAVEWAPKQPIVWPTRTSRVPKQRFTTEEFIEAVIAETARKYPLDRRHIVTLSWSSSGPAAYSASMSPGTSITGSFVAMSVFKSTPQELRQAKGQVYYIYHSPEDKVCPLGMAKRATKVLSDNGATTRMVEYASGHGWRGNMYKDIRAGLAWIMDLTAKREPASRPANKPVASRQDKPQK